MLAPAALLVLSLAPGQAPARAAETVDLPTRIAEVTVFPGQALVRRVGEAPGEGGELAIRGLPWSMDPTTVRVRCEGGDVVGLETRERVQDVVPSERVQELRSALQALQRERQGLTDERSLADDVKGHLQRLLKLEEGAHTEELKQGKVDPEAWRKNLAYITGELVTARKALREVEWKIEALDARIADVQADLGRSQQGEKVHLRDVIVDVLARGQGPVRLELEYLVGGAGWQPLYDLRTAADAKSVELSYRAQVWQQSGEDWTDVDLLLSTARPNLGAQGPEPQPIWVRIWEPGARGKSGAAPESLRALAYAEDMSVDAPATPGPASPAPFAAVESQGLSVRFRLATRETIESRDEPSTVLVGQANLEARPEYYVVPSLDTNVWLRGVTKNTSEWTMLPGKASVFFGADFVGDAHIELVQVGQELTLHLGADPALTVERKQTEDMKEGPGLFGSRETRSEAWLITLENHGAAAAGPDGAASVFVQEALPRSTDERIKVELAQSRPKPSDAERWKKKRDEEGILTWIVAVPRGGKAELAYQVQISYPQGLRVTY